jgi:hypothetical protein
MAYKPYRYVHGCPQSTAEDINALTDDSVMTEVSRRTFVRHTNDQDRRELERALGYGPWFGITRDWHVSYHKSVYRGVPCYYLQHSRIEHIFTLDGELGPSAGRGPGGASMWAGHWVRA